MEQALWFFISLPAKAVLPLDKRESYFVLFLKFLLLGKRRGTARGGGDFSLRVLVFPSTPHPFGEAFGTPLGS